MVESSSEKGASAACLGCISTKTLRMPASCSSWNEMQLWQCYRDCYDLEKVCNRVTMVSHPYRRHAVRKVPIFILSKGKARKMMDPIRYRQRLPLCPMMLSPTFNKQQIFKALSVLGRCKYLSLHFLQDHTVLSAPPCTRARSLVSAPTRSSAL